MRAKDTRDRSDRPKRSSRPGPKPNEPRLQAIEGLIAAQASTTQIVRTIRDEFKCGERAVYYDLARVHTRLEKEAEEERPRRKGQMRATLRGILQQALKAKDRKNAIGAARELAKLDGLYEEPHVRVNVGGQMGVAVDLRSQKLLDALRLTPVERARRIAELQGTPVGSGHASIERPEEPDAPIEAEPDPDEVIARAFAAADKELPQ